MWNSTSGLGFQASIAGVGSFLQTIAMFFFKAVTNLITFTARSAFGITDDNLFTDIGSLAPKTFGAKVMRIVKYSFGLDIIQAM
ncbi:MAG: hypothetical protein RSE05_10225 [Clostridium sp.]